VTPELPAARVIAVSSSSSSTADRQRPAVALRDRTALSHVPTSRVCHDKIISQL
jgi:hypothetical protein